MQVYTVSYPVSQQAYRFCHFTICYRLSLRILFSLTDRVTLVLLIVHVVLSSLSESRRAILNSLSVHSRQTGRAVSLAILVVISDLIIMVGVVFLAILLMLVSRLGLQPAKDRQTRWDIQTVLGKTIRTIGMTRRDRSHRLTRC